MRKGPFEARPAAPMAEDPVTPPADASGRSGLRPWLAGLAALQLILVLPALFLRGVGNEFDESHYHYPGVLLIRQHWPRLDLVNDCLSPIAPGYHYFLATCSMVTGPSLSAMRLVTEALSLPIPLLLFYWLSRYIPLRHALAYTLPLALCCFFLKASCRVLTDNPALLLMLLSLMGIFLLPARGWPGAWVGLTTGLGVMTRQLGASLMGPALLQVVLEKFGFDEERTRPWSAFLPGLAFRLLPLAVVAWLFHAWHGLVAPQWQTISFTLSATPVAYILAVAAFLGTLFILSLGRLVTLHDWRDPWVLGSAVAGFVVALISPTSWSPEHGRWGGWIWSLVAHLPSVDQRSILFMLISPWGAALIALLARMLWRQGQRKESLLWLCSIGTWASSYITGTNIYHHYFEAPLMIFFAVACALAARGESTLRLVWWPIALLLGYDLALYGAEIYGGVVLHLHLSDVKQ